MSDIYLGLSVGKASAKDMLDTDSSQAQTQDSEDALAYGLTLGYQLNQDIALDIGYLKLAEIETTQNAVSQQNNVLSYSSVIAKDQIDGFTLGLAGQYAVSDSWRLQYNVGLYRWSNQIATDTHITAVDQNAKVANGTASNNKTPVLEGNQSAGYDCTSGTCQLITTTPNPDQTHTPSSQPSEQFAGWDSDCQCYRVSITNDAGHSLHRLQKQEQRSGIDLYYGLGVAYDFSPYAVGIHYKVNQVDSAKISSLNLTLSYRFE
ncbi:hypothetical protein C2869_05035 [Saccharobesus litoralis]|uniref:Outer membrane protein OmpA-like transmembrane domain-containing protein n=1 Tax=Saccharobesus litoralis TaxID=2172099 RepID=A0A2S0VNS8_9ALTE|nr:hypothetical protein [Saccharobesus litoralis]AWB65843.1 hypothetical protein C2869_05035 [Saccharobesus litoralis]